LKSVYRAAKNAKFKLAALVLVSMGIGGCLVLDLPYHPAPAPAQSQSQALSDPEKGDGPHLPSKTNRGRLAYIGGDGNVYVTTADRRRTVAVTTDATAPAESQGLSYHRLSWSPDGRLAFASVTRAGNQARSRLYSVESPGGSARLVAEDDEHFVIYVYWSPVPCPRRPSCRHLAYLIEEDDGVGLRLVEIVADQTRNQLVDVGRPFYFSWSPDGQQILWHTGNATRRDSDALISIYDVKNDRGRDLPQAPGSFLAPAWSPQGDQWLAVSTAEGLDRLHIFPSSGEATSGASQATTLTAASGLEIVFTWSPRGNRVAFAIRPWSAAPFYGPIQVFDLDTGKSMQVTDEGFRILGFFWAPDGQRIAYLTRLDLPDAVWMQWRVYDLSEKQDRGFSAFYPTPLMRFMIHSFNQYAQSHRLWSPDGRYLVYADRDAALAERVWLVDTWAEKGADPILVGGGSIGIWSWN
jgi:TolB protein